MQIELFTFSKRYNSTKQATTGTGIRFNNVNLKDDCSIINPVILFAVDSMPVPSVAPSVYNYAYISKFQRYYFIDDWVYIGGIWEAHMSVDVLASNKTGIGSVSTMVERSYSSYDGNIVDKFYPIKTNSIITRVSAGSAYYGVTLSQGCFVLGIAGYPYNIQSSMGGVTYYVLSLSELVSFSQWMFNNNIYSGSNITDISEGLFKATFNPMQYVVSCMWFPFSPREFASTASETNIYLASYNTGIQALPLMADFMALKTSVLIPDHPQISRGSYLNFNPYTKVTLYYPPFGAIPIDLTFRSVGSYVKPWVYIDPITGKAELRVSLTDSTHASDLSEGNVCYTTSAQFGVPIQLSQSVIESLNMGNTSVLGAPMQALKATVNNMASEMLGSALSGESYTSGFGTVSTTGANGSMLMIHETGCLIVEQYQITNEDRAEFGRPLYQVKTINTMSGYIKCSDAHVELPITDAERKKIVSLMNAGFFYE